MEWRNLLSHIHTYLTITYLPTYLPTHPSQFKYPLETLKIVGFQTVVTGTMVGVTTTTRSFEARCCVCDLDLSAGLLEICRE
jgi:hypothetical protein